MNIMWIFFLYLTKFLYSAEASGEIRSLPKDGTDLRNNLQNEVYFSAEDQRLTLKQKKKCKEKIKNLHNNINQDLQLETCLKESVIRIVIKYLCLCQ